MHSSLLVEYMRTGDISPLKKTDTMREVEAKLGSPDDWAGRRPSFGVTEPLIADFHRSWAWRYNSLGVTFPHPNLYGPPGISLDYGDDSIIFAPPFEELPQERFTLGEIIELLRVHDISFNDNRRDRDFYTPIIVTEGAVAVSTLHCDYSSSAEVIGLHSHEYTCA